MKSIFYSLFFALILVASCKKDSEDPATPNPFIVLEDPIVKDDQIEISWSKLSGSQFASLDLYRKDFDDSEFRYLQYLNVNEASAPIIDINVPYSPTLSYQIKGSLMDGTFVSSNVVTVKNSGINILNIDAFDVIYLPEDHLLYFFEVSGQISLYDLNKNQLVKQIQTGSKIGYSGIDYFEGKKELMVPRSDGWVFVYDALTLEKTGQFSTGNTCYSIVANHDVLYVVTDAMRGKSMKIYNRKDKEQINEIKETYNERIIKIPNSNTEILELFPYHTFYGFNERGEIKQHLTVGHQGSSVDPSIFSFLHGGQKHITSSEGSIYRNDLTYEGGLPRGSLEFTCFSFDERGTEIYAGTSTKSIEVYSAQTYEHLRSIKTKAHPFRIFASKEGIISVGFSSINNWRFDENNHYIKDDRIIIEKFNQ